MEKTSCETMAEARKAVANSPCECEYKGKKYEFQRADLKMKDPSSGDWVSAVLYQSKETGQSYIRQAKDFYAKFKVAEA